MPITIPPLSLAKRQITNQCDLIRAKIAAIAFMPSGAVIASATNRILYSIPDEWSIHAEAFLIKKLRKIRAIERYKDVNILVARWSPLKQAWDIAKPCSNCQIEIARYGIKKVFYTNEFGEISEARF